MANETPVKKSTNPIVFVGIGCLVLLVILGIMSSIVMRFFAKRVGVGLLQSAIESKTGVKTNLQDVANGKMSFTDTKTGAKMDIGSGTLPDTFPKDFPIYPGAKVVSALSGANNGKSNGFWVTLSTSDSQDKVASFYKGAFKAQGWTESASYSAANVNTETVTKGTWSGTVAISFDTSKKETDIVIVLGQETPTPTTQITDTPSDTGSGE